MFAYVQLRYYGALALCFLSLIAVGQSPKVAFKIVAYNGTTRAETGSAFFIDQKGTAVTCYHVILGAQRIDAFLGERDPHPVRVLSYDEVYDLASVVVDGVASVESLAPKKGPSGPLKKLHLKLFIGFLNGSEHAVLEASAFSDTLVASERVEAEGKSVFALEGISLISFTTEGNYKGVSGSALVDVDSGRAIGVYEGSISQGGGQGWAIPIEYVPLRATDQPHDPKTISWRPLKLMRADQADRFKNSLEVGSDFEAHLTAAMHDLTNYSHLLESTSKTFAACRESASEWMRFVQSLPDGAPWPQILENANSREDLKTYVRLSAAEKQNCTTALILYSQIAQNSEQIRLDANNTLDDLRQVISLNPTRQPTTSLTDEFKQIEADAGLKLSTAESMWKAANANLEVATRGKEVAVYDTTSLKRWVDDQTTIAQTVASESVEKLSRLYLDAIREDLSLNGDLILFLSSSQGH